MSYSPAKPNCNGVSSARLCLPCHILQSHLRCCPAGGAAPRRAAPSFFLPSFSSPPAETVEQFIQCHTFVAPIRTYPSGFRARARARAHIWALFRCLLDDPFIQTESVCILTVPQAAIERMNVCGFLKHRPRHLISDRLRPYLK